MLDTTVVFLAPRFQFGKFAPLKSNFVRWHIREIAKTTGNSSESKLLSFNDNVQTSTPLRHVSSTVIELL